jgi:hypothetical protein
MDDAAGSGRVGIVIKSIVREVVAGCAEADNFVDEVLAAFMVRSDWFATTHCPAMPSSHIDSRPSSASPLYPPLPPSSGCGVALARTSIADRRTEWAWAQCGCV